MTGRGGLSLTSLPEDCIAAVLMLTGPKDACKVAQVSNLLKRVADSDTVWEKFLPPDYCLIVPGSESWPTRKALYRSLCNEPILIDDGRRSLSLDKDSGKWCSMLSARSLSIVWGDTPRYWTWTPLPDARFPEVAQLLHVWWFEIRCAMSTARLSADTFYLAYLVFKHNRRVIGFEGIPIETEVGVVGSEPGKRIVSLMGGRGQGSSELRMRRDGWLEVELGEFFNGRGPQEELQVSILEIKRLNLKSGLIIQGIELRPRYE